MTELSAAPCPHHRDAQVTFTCVRCGTFGRDTCRSPLPDPLCSTCGARVSAQELPVAETLQESFQFLVRHPLLLLATASVFAVQGVIANVSASPSTCLMSTVLTFSDLKLSGQYTGERQDG